MRIKLATVSVAAVLFASASCSDGRSTQSLPTIPDARQSRATGSLTAPVPGTCVTPNGLATDVSNVVPPGPARGEVNGDIGTMRGDINKGDIAGAQALAFNLNKILIGLYKAGSLTGTPAQTAKLINDIFCFAGLASTIIDPGNSDVVLPTDPPRTIITTDGTGGISLPGGAVSEPTVITLTILPDIFGGSGHGPLHTKLDQYAGFLDITKSSATDAPLAKLVIVAVCPPPGMDPIIRARLRLGHDATGGFEITPPADGSFLSCATTVGAAPSRIERWLGALASLVSPRPAYARAPMLAAGGVGGTAGEFSPFDAIDPSVSFSGGVGGTAGEFQIGPRGHTSIGGDGAKPAAAGANSITAPRGPLFDVGGGCPDPSAFAGTALDQSCSPAISLSTYLGTKLAGVPVVWTITAGGGTVATAVPVPWSCGAFGASTATTTDINGESHVCWTMGPTVGHRNNTLVATPAVGGDASAGVTFVPATGTFTASALARTPTASATGATVQFDNAPHTGSGTCSDGLIPVLSYTLGGAPVSGSPINVGSYVLTVTCGDGNVRFITVTSTAPIVITPATTTTVVSCPTAVWFTGSPQTPCTASVTGPGLSLSLTPSYSSNTAIGTATASAAYAGGSNWSASSGSTTFQIIPGFTDGFESESGWTSTGLWHRSTLRTPGGSPIVNTLYPAYVSAGPNDAYATHGTLPAPFAGSWTFWYGSEAAGNYVGTQLPGDALNSGGTSTTPNAGTLTSPPIALPSVSGRSLILRFNAWWEVEGLHPSTRDVMGVSVYDVDAHTTTPIGVLNPTTDPTGRPNLPFTSGGYAGSPRWVEIVKNLNAFSGRTIRLVFSFDTKDASINGFRGLLIDNVRVATETTP